MSGFFGKNITRRELALSTGAALVGTMPSGAGSVSSTLDNKLNQSKNPKDKGIDETGNIDCIINLQAMVNELPLDGTIELTAGAFYRITDTLTINSRHLYCKGKATIIADLANAAKDALSLSSTLIRNGTMQNYKPAPKLEGICIVVKSTLRDGIRVNGGEYPVWDRVDVQRDQTSSPSWRDGIHVEASANGEWTENISWRNVRVSDAGRDGFRFEVPAAAWGNTFINVASLYDCEVRGAGLSSAGVPMRWVSNSTNANNKLSQFNIIGGEYAINSAAPSLNPDCFKADKVGGGASIENINITGLTSECIPIGGTGLGINTTNMSRVTISNYLPYGFTGASTGTGGAGDYVVFGYLGLDSYIPQGALTIGLKGGTTAGAPPVSYQLGSYSRVGKIVTLNFEIQISGWGGAAGQITITGLPFQVSANGRPTGVPWSLNAITFTGGYSQCVFVGVPGTNTLVLYQLGSGVNRADVNVSQATAAFQIAGSITYFAD